MTSSGRSEDNRPLRLAVLASGRGTNLQAVLDAIAAGRLNAEVVLVVCNHRGAGAIARSEAAGVPVMAYDWREHPSRAAEQLEVAARLQEARVDLVVCAGWDRVLKAAFVAGFAGRIINIHPSLLPAFAGGLHAIEEAYKYGVKVTGCTVHFVTEEVDAGPIIAQAAVSVAESDTLDSLAEKVHAEEHRLLVEAIDLYSKGCLRVSGRKVEIVSDRA